MYLLVFYENGFLIFRFFSIFYWLSYESFLLVFIIIELVCVILNFLDYLWGRNYA